MLGNILPKLPKLQPAAYSYFWDKKADAILPEHYKQRCLDFLTRAPTYEHQAPQTSKWKYDTTQHKVIPVQQVPIRVIYPPLISKCLLGGDGYIKGFVKKKRLGPRIPKVWGPVVRTEYLYSEVLDTWYKINLSPHVRNQITTMMGLDYYILETHERDLNSQLGMMLKRKMLMALAQPGTLYPDNPKQKDIVLRSYGRYTIPYEEAEWIGLPSEVAIAKAKVLLEEEEDRTTLPLKDVYGEQYLRLLQGQVEAELEASN